MICCLKDMIMLYSLPELPCIYNNLFKDSCSPYCYFAYNVSDIFLYFSAWCTKVPTKAISSRSDPPARPPDENRSPRRPQLSTTMLITTKTNMTHIIPHQALQQRHQRISIHPAPRQRHQRTSTHLVPRQRHHHITHKYAHTPSASINPVDW